MRGVVFAADYILEEDKTVVVLVGRDENKVRIMLRDASIQPHFYVPATVDKSKLRYKDIAKVEDYHLQTDTKEDVKKITTFSPSGVKRLRIRFDVYHEGDIPFEDRYLIDKELTGGFEVKKGKICPNDSIHVSPRIMYIDIEVASPEGIFPNPSIARYPIVVIGCYDSYENKHHTFYSSDIMPYLPDTILHKKKNEVIMLFDFIKWIHNVDPDYFAGWNVSKFDLAYLITRCLCFNLPVHRLSLLNRVFVRKDGKGIIRGKRSLELRDAYFEKIKQELPSYTLAYIAKRELGEEMKDIKDFAGTWENNPVEVIKRNMKHVDWLVKIDRKRELSDFFERLRRFVGCSIEKLTHGKIADMVLLRACKDKFVKSGMAIKKGPRYRAAIVFEPVRGLHKNVIVLDFKTTYPSIMIDHNLPPGLIPETIKKFLKWRAKIKEEMKITKDPVKRKTLDLDQFALKSITNTFYGILGAGSRWREVRWAEKITEKGREYLKELRKETEDMGYENVAGDTDSNFTKGKSDNVKDEGENLAQLLTENLRKYIKEKYKIKSMISVELDRIYISLLIKDKKFYAGYLLGEEEKELEIKGMIKRGSMSMFACIELENLIKLLLDGNKLGSAYLKELWLKFSKSLPADICPPAILRKHLKDYAKTDDVIRGAAYSNLYLGTTFSKGDRFKVAWVKGYPKDKPFTDVIAFTKDIPNGYELDKKRVFKTFNHYVKEILNLISMKRQTKMERWLA